MMDRLKTAISLAVKSGKLLEENYGNIFQENQKDSLRDIVTEIDIISENLIIDSLKKLYPNDSILSEEHGYFPKDENSIWIIDALDGTVNFLNNIPMFCVSIAYWRDQKPLIGVIYNPISSELYYAADGLGAFLNLYPQCLFQVKHFLSKIEKKNLKFLERLMILLEGA